MVRLAVVAMGLGVWGGGGIGGKWGILPQTAPEFDPDFTLIIATSTQHITSLLTK